jgi:hypothetical protein
MLRTGSLTSAAWAKSRCFSLAEIKAGPKVEHNVTVECSGNPPAGGLIGNAKWAGTIINTGTEKITDADYVQNFARSLPAEDTRAISSLHTTQRTATRQSAWRSGAAGRAGPVWSGLGEVGEPYRSA